MLRDAHMAQELTAALARAVSDERWQDASQELDALQASSYAWGPTSLTRSREEAQTLHTDNKDK